MVHTPHIGQTSSPRSDEDLRSRLLFGLGMHFVVFAAGITLLFVINWVARSSDGGWWVVWPLYIWASAWALHLVGVGLALPSERHDS